MTIKQWSILAAIVACIAGGAWLTYDYMSPKIALAKSNETQAKAVTAATQKARVEEHKVAASDNAASTDYQKGLEDGKTQLQAANDKLSAQLKRLRQQSASTNGVSSVSSANSGCNASSLSAFPAGYRDAIIQAIGAFGLSQQQLASEADDQAKQLTAAQKELLARSNSSGVM